MRRTRARQGDDPEAVAHVAPNGFRWRVAYPERTSAGIGARRPLARVLVGEGDGDAIGVPIAVARRLESSEGPEPSSRAELSHRISSLAGACAWERVVAMAARREYSSSEAAARLTRDGYLERTAEEVVAKAVRLRIIDDRRFADSFVRSKLSVGWGTRKIERELSSRGIEPADVPGWPDAYLDGEDLGERALALLRPRRVPERNAFPKFVRFLVSRGYPTGVAMDAARARIDEEASC